MPRNKKEKNISQTDDDLLLDLAKNPIFNEMPTKKNKIKIDSRFKKMLTDRRFDERNFLVDKRGKPVIRGKEGNFAKRIYEVSEESECSNSQDDQSNEEEEDEGEGSAKVYREIKNIKRRTAKDGNFDDTVITNEDLESMDEEDNSDDKDSSDCEDLPRISLDLARGEAPDINSSSSEDEEEDLSEHSDEEKSDGPDLESGVRRVEWASSRLAICNVDWSKISAEALMIVCLFFFFNSN